MSFLREMFPWMFLGENRRDNELRVEIDPRTIGMGMNVSAFTGSRIFIKKDDDKNVRMKEDKPIKRKANPKKKKTLKKNKDVGSVSQPKIEKKSRNYVCQPDIKLSDYNE